MFKGWMKSSSKPIQMKATIVAPAKLRVCTVADTRKKSNYVVNTLVWLRRVTMLYIADLIKVTLSLEIALWVRSYSLVVTQGDHCSEFIMRKCPMRNCQFPMPKVTFIESAVPDREYKVKS